MGEPRRSIMAILLGEVLTVAWRAGVLLILAIGFLAQTIGGEKNELLKETARGVAEIRITTTEIKGDLKLSAQTLIDHERRLQQLEQWRNQMTRGGSQ